MRGIGANVKTRYAVQVVLYLAVQERERVVAVSEMAVAVGISPKFLEDTLAALRAAGIVLSRRGKEGGYRLAPAPAELSVWEVVQAVEGPITAPDGEVGGPLAQVTAKAFDRALDAAVGVLARLTIAHLADEERRLEAEEAKASMYHI